MRTNSLHRFTYFLNLFYSSLHKYSRLHACLQVNASILRFGKKKYQGEWHAISIYSYQLSSMIQHTQITSCNFAGRLPFRAEKQPRWPCTAQLHATRDSLHACPFPGHSLDAGAYLAELDGAPLVNATQATLSRPSPFPSPRVRYPILPLLLDPPRALLVHLSYSKYFIIIIYFILTYFII